MSDLAELATALSAFQSEMPTVAKSKRASVPTKSGGSYTYTYAGLADVTEVAMPVLTKHGLSFTCLPKRTESGIEVVGMLLHKSGQSLEAVLPMRGGSPQEIGSWLTYARRYLFGAMTGVVTEDDDDGQAAQKGAKRQPKAQPEPSAASTGARRMSRGEPQQITEAQLGMLLKSLDDRGIREREARLDYCRQQVRRDIGSSKDLTKREASQIIDSLRVPDVPTEDPPADDADEARKAGQS